jgi:hypothetical protein
MRGIDSGSGDQYVSLPAVRLTEHEHLGGIGVDHFGRRKLNQLAVELGKVYRLRI